MRASVPTTARPKRGADLEDAALVADRADDGRGCRRAGAWSAPRRAARRRAGCGSSVDVDDGRQRPDVRREVREEAADLLERLVLGVDGVVDGARPGCATSQPPSSSFVSCLARGVLDERRAGRRRPAPRP